MRKIDERREWVRSRACRKGPTFAACRTATDNARGYVGCGGLPVSERKYLFRQHDTVQEHDRQTDPLTFFIMSKIIVPNMHEDAKHKKQRPISEYVKRSMLQSEGLKDVTEDDGRIITPTATFLG